MNQVFDFRRFTLLVGKHWSENRKKYLFGIGGMIALLVFWFAFILLVDERRIPNELQAMTYYFGLAITGCFFGSILFSDIASGPKAMSYLSFPASHLEKLICGLLYGVVIFFGVFTLAFYLVDIPMVMFSDKSTVTTVVNGVETIYEDKVVNIFGNPFNVPEGNPGPTTIFLYSYVAVQSAFILGGVYFPKFSFLKTAIVLLLLVLFLVFFLTKVLSGILPEGNNFSDLSTMRVYEPDGNYTNYKTVALPYWMQQTLKYVVQFAFAPIFWVVTYFRIKEKQV
ncbi:MAG: hypothetical protein EOO02_03780 [Chitinophagaceae bacterium]|nr:MAG: hypothetical protein EOO02_03780 [Chitinophagaceae bacterium]